MIGFSPDNEILQPNYRPLFIFHWGRGQVADVSAEIFNLRQILEEGTGPILFYFGNEAVLRFLQQFGCDV